MSDVRVSHETQSLHLPTPLQVSSLEVLKQILEIAPDACMVFDQAGAIVMVNELAEAMFGYTHAELCGKNVEVLLPHRFREIHVRHREHYVTAPRTRPMGAGLQLFGLRKDGSEFPVDISLRPLLLHGVLHILGAIRDVTQQRIAERERLQQLQHIRLQAELIHQAHDAILIRDPINRILFWNQGAEQLYGWSAQEALGRLAQTLLKTLFPLSRESLEIQLEQNGRWEGELTHICRDGHPVVVESRQKLMRDETGQLLAILEINRDVTERHCKAQEEQNVYAQTSGRLAFLQQVLDALPESVYLVHGADAHLIFANRASSRIWGAQWQVEQPMQEFLAQNGIEIMDAQGRPLAPEMVATLRAVQPGKMIVQRQETVRRADGSSLPVLVNAVPLTSSHLWSPTQGMPELPLPPTEPIALLVHQDVTALKEAEYLKDEFVGVAAHELRTPLAVLTGYADMLLMQTARGRGSPLADWQREALEEIKQATARLVTLTEDLLDVTRLQAGRLALQHAPINVVALIQRVAAQMQRTTVRHQITVHTTHDVLVADIDAKRTEQVLTNLIGNAIKYSPLGGPIPLTLERDVAAQVLQVSVQDTGIGIPSHQQAQIFGRFIRADNALAWGISGTGLGLYLCRELVERQGGRLWFESKEGTGSTFFLTLPLFPTGQGGDVAPPPCDEEPDTST